MYAFRKQRQAIALVLVVSVTMLLSVMAVAFVRVSFYEQAAAGNYSAKIEAKLAALAGFDRAVAEIYANLREGKTINEARELDPTNFIMLAYPDSSNGNLAQASAAKQALSLLPYSNATTPKATPVLGTTFSYSGTCQHGRYDPQGNFYALKISDQSDGFNVNSHISSHPLQSNSIVNRILFTLAKSCSSPTITDTQAQAIANAIRPGNNNPAPAYTSMQEVQNTLTALNPAGFNKDQFLGNLCTASWMPASTDANTCGVYNSVPRVSSQPPTYYKEQRAAVNVNTMSEELLMALIANIKATVVMYNTSSLTAPVSDDSADEDKPFPNEDSMNYTSQQVQIEFSSLSLVQLRQLANKILHDSVVTTKRRIFQDIGQFEKHLDAISASLTIPSKPGTYSWVDAVQWRQACVDALKSNFNPHVIDNFWSPNRSYYRIACKGDLFLNSSGCRPYHTTELCFISFSGIEITSLGRVTANNYTSTVATVQVSAILNFGAILGEHTTQTDFYTGDNANWVTFPTNMNPPVTTPAVNPVANIFGGGVEPRPVNNVNLPDASTKFYYGATYFTGNTTYDDAARAFPLTAIPNMNNATPPRLAMTPEQYGAKNLAHDGIISRSLQYPSLMNSRYFVTHAFSSTAFARSDGAAEGITYRGNNSASQHVGSYQGSIKMFIKLTQDAGSISKRGVPCGILAVHSKSKLNTATEDCPFADDPDFSSTYAANKYHEGSQMYLYINTMGKLRLTRLCYAFTFHTAIEGGNTVIKKYGSVDKDEKDPGRSYPRKDIEVDVSTWKAYEWHYINIYWNDNTGVLAIEIDGQDTANNNVFDDPDNYGIGYCILNEVNPHDSFFLNGFFRREKMPGGYFLFASNIDYPGNAVIDQVVSKLTTSASAVMPQRYSPTSPISYSNSFLYPGGTGGVPSGSFWGPIYWNSYPALAEHTTLPISGRSYVNLVVSGYSRYAVTTGDPIAQKLVTSSFKTGNLSYLANFYISGMECPALIAVTALLLFPVPQMTNFAIE